MGGDGVLADDLRYLATLSLVANSGSLKEKEMKIAVFLMLFLSASTLCLAQENEKMVAVPESSLTAQQKALAVVNDARPWVGLGKEIGEATNGALSAITTQADSFSKTGVGKFVMFMVAWKVLGNELVRVGIGVPMYLLLVIIWCYSFYKNCITRSVLTKVLPDKTKEYEIVNGPSQRYGDAGLNIVRAVHACILIGTTVIAALTIFTPS